MQGLKVLVVVMGVLIVGGTVTLVVLLAGRMSGGADAIASAAVLDEPVGTRVAGASVTQDRVAVHLQGGGPDRVAVVDTRTGRVVARVRLAQ